MEIIFAHTRYEYPSYTDYRELVRLAGFQTCFIDQIDFTRPDTVYVVSPLNGEYRPHRDNWRHLPHRARIVWWSLERPGNMGDFVSGTKALMNDHYFDYMWVSDRWLRQQINDARCMFVILGSHEDLGTTTRGPFQYDVCHMSCDAARRRDILNPLEKSRIRLAPNAWGKDRHNKLKTSKFMLNVHQDDWPVVEPLRFALAAAYALPVISETMKDPYPYSRQGDNHYIVQAGHQYLTSKIKGLLSSNYDSYQAMGIRMHEMMCGRYSFKRQVRRATTAIALINKELVTE